MEIKILKINTLHTVFEPGDGTRYDLIFLDKGDYIGVLILNIDATYLEISVKDLKDFFSEWDIPDEEYDKWVTGIFAEDFIADIYYELHTSSRFTAAAVAVAAYKSLERFENDTITRP